MKPLRQPLALGDIFDRTFSVIGKVFTRNLLIGSVLIIPAAVILSMGMQSYFSSLSDVVAKTSKMKSDSLMLKESGGLKSEADEEESISESEEESNPESEEPSISEKETKAKEKAKMTEDVKKVSLAMLSSLFIAGIGLILFYCASIGSNALCSYVVCSEFNEERLPVKKLFTSDGIRIIRRALGQEILQMLLYGGMLFIVIIGAMIVAITGTSGVLFPLFLMMIWGIIVLYLSVRWSFTIVAIANEQVGITESFGRSANLVKSYWWRTLGIKLLLGFITMFAVSLIVTPLSFYFLWDFYSSYYHSLGSGGSAGNPADMMKMFHSFGWAMGATIGVDALLKLLIEPAYKCAMYFDLRARHNEFEFKQESILSTLFSSGSHKR